MNDYGLVISEPGYNADTDAPENMIFDTRFDTPKSKIDLDNPTIRRFNFLFTTNPAPGTYRMKTVTHNLGYTPLTISFLDNNPSTGQAMGFVVGHFFVAPAGFGFLGEITVKATDTEIQIDFTKTAPMSGFPDYNMTGKSFIINVYIFVNDSKG